MTRHLFRSVIFTLVLSFFATCPQATEFPVFGYHYPWYCGQTEAQLDSTSAILVDFGINTIMSHHPDMVLQQAAENDFVLVGTGVGANYNEKTDTSCGDELWHDAMLRFTDSLGTEYFYDLCAFGAYGAMSQENSSANRGYL